MSSPACMISVVSPVYRAEKIVPELVARVEKQLRQICGDSYEIVLVEDRGPDHSWQVIQSIASSNPKVKGIRLSRNFGQHPAITAGLDASTGEYVIVMDCDLQDVPEEIPKLYNKILEGYDCVVASRYNRQDGYFKKLFSKLFHQSLTYLTGTYHDASVANFGIYKRKVVNAIVGMRESIRYFPVQRTWVGFNRTTIEVDHASRFEGETSYNFARLINLAIDIILAYSDKPLRIMVKLGMIISVISILTALSYVVYAIVEGFDVLGYASLIISIWFFSGLIISMLGIVGLYVGKTFEGVKSRPIYIIDERLNG